MVDAKKNYQRWKKVAGKHHMFCAVRDQKVVLGPGQPDGDVAYFTKAQAPPTPTAAWEQLDGGPEVDAEALDVVDKPEGTLVVKETDSKGWYNVINTATGKPVNTSKLRKDDAEAMVAGSPPAGGDAN